jgi:hypothetical protein
MNGSGECIGAVPTGMLSKQYREVKILRADNGFIVCVGCKTFVAKEWSEVVLGLEDYWKDPYEAEKKWCTK